MEPDKLVRRGGITPYTGAEDCDGTPLSKSPEYQSLLANLKQRIQEAQVRAGLAVNRELVLLYWSIGREILSKQQAQGWGAKVIDSLAGVSAAPFPTCRGYPLEISSTCGRSPKHGQTRQLCNSLLHKFRGGMTRLLDHVKSPEERQWYVQQTIANGWSRNILLLQIESGLYRRQGRALTNFTRALPEPQSDLAQQILKDPYNFDFLTLSSEAKERDLERALLDHIRQFLLEMGVGFAFVGSQYPLEIAGQNFRLDLLFYHLRLRAFIVVEIKAATFKPEYTGKMNFYLSAVDDLLRHPTDQPSIGLILCKSKDQIIVEYALRDTAKPMGIAEFRLFEKLPENLKKSLPSIEELEAELVAAAEPDDQASGSSSDSGT